MQQLIDLPVGEELDSSTKATIRGGTNKHPAVVVTPTEQISLPFTKLELSFTQ
jgi:hypothetical protein